MPTTAQPDNTKFSNPEAKSLTPETTKKGLTNKQKIGMAAAGLALFSAIGGGAIAKNMNQPNQATTTEAPANPDQAPQSPSEVTTAVASAESGVEKYANVMEKYVDMDVDTFEALPRDERLLYAEYAMDKSIANGDYESAYGSGDAKEFQKQPVAVNIDNNGQEIMDDHIYKYQLSGLQFVEGEVKPFDIKDGAKVLSAAYYEVGKSSVVSSEYLGTKKNGESLPTVAITKEEATAINTSEIQDGIDLEGNKVKYKVVTYYDENAKTLYAKYVYHEFTNYDGSRKSVWLMDINDYSIDGLNANGSVK